MALFQQIGKQISGFGHKAVENTESFVEINRLNSMIDYLRRDLPKLYADLGQAYYERHCDGGGIPEFRERISAIQDIHAKIDNCQQQILQARGVEICWNCHTEVAAGALFCSNCGVKIIRDAM